MTIFKRGEPNHAEVQTLRSIFPEGCMIQLTEMLGEDHSIYKPGLEGVLRKIDDKGQFHVSWNGAASLPLTLEVDKFNVVTCKGCGAPIIADTKETLKCNACGRTMADTGIYFSEFTDARAYAKKHLMPDAPADDGKDDFTVIRIRHTHESLVEHLEVRTEDGTTVELFAYPGGPHREEWRFFYLNGKMPEDPDFEHKVLGAL